MDEFIVIKVMNESMLRTKKGRNEEYSINEEIKKTLEDEALFFKVSKETALKILTNVGVAKDMLEETYVKLTNKEVYNKLLSKGILKNE